MKKPLIVLTGPTAVGKTSLSIMLAKRINGAIISADSMQVYKGMDIGTAKIKEEEMDGISHYLIDILDPNDEFNVVKFQTLTKKHMKEIYSSGKIPIIVGGTGFYIQSVLYDINFSEEANDNIRQELEEFYKSNGKEALYEILLDIDKESANLIHSNNVKKVIRAIEYYRKTGNKISEHNAMQRQNQSPYNFKYFVLTKDRNKLYDSINERVDIMIKNGLVEEVESLLNKGYSKELVSMQGLGYKEIVGYLDDEYSLDEAIYILKRDTRHFAKRQLTWFRREKEVTFIDKDNYENDSFIVDYMIKEIFNKGIYNKH